MKHILLIEDEAVIRGAVAQLLERHGYRVSAAAKPFDHDQLLRQIARILKRGAGAVAPTAPELQSVPGSETTEPVAGMVGNCPAMQEIRRRIAKVAPTASTVLILGESGTGKELVARALHRQSPRRNAPFVTVNCAAIPEPLVESEIFGNEPAAVGGPRPGLVESADGGTLFLDEIGDLPQPSQARHEFERKHSDHADDDQERRRHGK